MIVLKLSQDLEEIINKWKKITSYLLLLFKCYLFFCVWNTFKHEKKTSYIFT